MDAIEAIRTRRSVGKVKPEAPAKEDIALLLDLAVQAPNHHLTEPWRFCVLAGRAREELGRALEAALAATGEADEAKLAKERAKPLRAPVVIVVSAKPGKDEIETHENRMAAAAAVENLLLAAHASGLGAMWRTGDTMYSPQVSQYLGLALGEMVLASVYVGYPDMPLRPGRRTAAVQFTTWRGWE